MPFDFKLPDLGEGIHEAEILSVKVTEGQNVNEDQALFEVETDKAVVEIPSPVAGKVLKVNVKVGEIVTVGSVMISIEESSSSEKERAIEKRETEEDAKSTSRGSDSAVGSSDKPAVNLPDNETKPVIATPATRQLARELKIDLHQITGSGPGGRISREDVLAYGENQSGKKAMPPPASTVSQVSALPDFAKFGAIERVPMRSLRRKTAQLMALSWANIPHVTHCDEADVTKLNELIHKYKEAIKKKGAKLTLTAFVMKAVAIALQKFPDFNTSFDEKAEEIVYKRYYNIGMAVATERGLIVPVIQSVDKKSISELALDIVKIAEKARASKLELSELQGATFTITNIGAIGGTSATPIIHYPEAAILAVMKTKERPVIRNGKVEVGIIMPLCLAFDHRLADGAEAAQFISAIIKILEDPSAFEKVLGI